MFKAAGKMIVLYIVIVHLKFLMGAEHRKVAMFLNASYHRHKRNTPSAHGYVVNLSCISLLPKCGHMHDTPGLFSLPITVHEQLFVNYFAKWTFHFTLDYQQS
jgi:hypothetical protein